MVIYYRCSTFPVYTPIDQFDQPNLVFCLQQERNPVKRTETYSPREEPRTVETLKHLLLNLNDIRASEEKAPVTEVSTKLINGVPFLKLGH